MDRQPELSETARALRESRVFRNKTLIHPVAGIFDECCRAFNIRNGDDAAVIPDGDGYLLLAAEGMTESLVRSNPYLAGRSAVLANVNDIYAMGGRPLAMVDVVGTPDEETAREICRGMRDNAARFRVPIVGGHLLRTASDSSVALAILGRAKRCITSFDAAPGDLLVLVTKPEGRWLGDMGFWNCTLEADDASLVPNLELLPRAAEAGLVAAGKDVSMSGIAGTAVMLAESSRVGAVIDLDRIVPPPGVPFVPWLLAFLSYGFLLAVGRSRLDELKDLFLRQGLPATPIGSFREERRVMLRRNGEEVVLWDFAESPFAGGSPL